MECERFKNLIDTYIDEEGTEAENNFIENHIKYCEECNNIYNNKLMRNNLIKDSVNYISVDKDYISRNIGNRINSNVKKEIRYIQDNRKLKYWSYSSTLIAIISIILLFVTNANFNFDYFNKELNNSLFLIDGNTYSVIHSSDDLNNKELNKLLTYDELKDKYIEAVYRKENTIMSNTEVDIKTLSKINLMRENDNLDKMLIKFNDNLVYFRNFDDIKIEKLFSKYILSSLIPPNLNGYKNTQTLLIR